MTGSSVLDFLSRPAAPALLEALRAHDAVRLFVDRALLMDAGFALTAENAVVVAHICRTLDSLPLAIELAAARLIDMTLCRIVVELTDRFAVLTIGNAGALPRQQTLAAVMEWSYALLAEDERMLWRRLSVFHEGCTEDAARAVCAGHGIAARAIPRLLDALVAASIVRKAVTPVGARYTMLETVREYGLSRLHNT